MSDIHVGANHLAETWPRFNTIFLDDIARKVELAGPIDTIVFSGDLVQFGAKNEFDRFDEVADNIISRLSDVQDIPQIVTVPGNHDLSRAKKGATEGLALKQYWNDDEVRGTFWSEDGESLRQFVNDRFEAYHAWREDAIKSGRHMAPIEQGLLVGDSTYQLEKSFGKIGFVCLNSTWLQLTGGDYDGQLHVDAKQLLNVTENDADSWCRQNAVNLLITHQPSSWLRTSGPTSWANDINPPGRFDFHLFGHMHEPIAERSSVGGGLDRRSIQAASLFGLQTFGPDKVDRIQGYSSNEIRIDDQKRVFTNWPRRLTQVTSGALKLVPDSSQDIDEATGSFSYDYEIASRGNLNRLPAKVETSHNPVDDFEKQAAFDAQSLAFDLVGLSAHRNVRLVEQDKCAQALQEHKVVWLVSDWGMGKEGFIASVVERVGVSADHVFSIDLGEYVGREAFFEGLKATHGASLNQICDAFAELKNVILILDDIDVLSPSADEKELVSMLKS